MKIKIISILFFVCVANIFGDENKKLSKLAKFKIDTDLEIMFPDDYINNVNIRLNQYQKLSEIKDLKSLRLYESER